MNDRPQNTKGQIPTFIGRLLYEISWEGNAKRGYRAGGRGRENVLTAEALLILDCLPRTEFLGEVIQHMHGASRARQAMLSEVERLDLQVLPPEILLAPSARTKRARGIVQPDGHLAGNAVYCLIEAKRIRPAAFQAKQLAREVVAAVKTADDREPLVALLLGHPPPIHVKNHGELSIEEAVDLHLSNVVERETEAFELPLEEVRARIPEILCWITWNQIAEIVMSQAGAFTSESVSVQNAVRRMAQTMGTIVTWHS